MGRKKLDRDSLHARVAPDTSDRLKQIAFNLGFVYGDEGSTGQLLDAIASGEVVLISARNFAKVVNTYSADKV